MSKHSVYSCASRAKALELVKVAVLALPTGVGRKVFFIEENEYERADSDTPARYYMITLDTDKMPADIGEWCREGNMLALRAQAFIRGYLLGMKHGKAKPQTAIVKGRRAVRKSSVIEDADTYADVGTVSPSAN